MTPDRSSTKTPGQPGSRPGSSPQSSSKSRRAFLRTGAAVGSAVAGALTSCSDAKAPDAGPSRLGAPLSEYGTPSAHEQAARHMRATKTPEMGSTRTPLQDLSGGIITPSGLHFERHHSGVPAIDPAEHRLLIHGLVERPLVLTMDELRRLPSVTRVHFVECAGNSGSECGAKKGATAQMSHGLASCSEWTGVLLSVVLEEVGVEPDAKWIIAEGGDACNMQRSLPLDKCRDDVLLAFGQNGEAIRPEQGYPVRLMVPGWEGNVNVKWLRRLKVTDQPVMARDETSKYTDLLANGKARLFSFPMEAKSVITFPSGGQSLNGAGPYEISGLAWSGRGVIERVEVSTDGGATWQDSGLQEPRHRFAFTRFRLPWSWDGSETTILSRASDDSGYVQPTVEALIESRGPNSNYHNNGIKAWKVAGDGSVSNV